MVRRFKKARNFYSFSFPKKFQDMGFPEEADTYAFSPRQALTYIIFREPNLGESYKYLLETELYPVIDDLLVAVNGIAVVKEDKTVPKYDAGKILDGLNLKFERTSGGTYKLLKKEEQKPKKPKGYKDVIGEQFRLPFPPVQLTLFNNALFDNSI